MTSAAQAPSLGSYRVIRRLGAGGMAEVFLASQHMAENVARTVVIKAMLPHLADDDHFVQMFMREARVAALLSHPNIVNIHDVSVLDSRPCIIMEFLRGRDLWQLLRSTSLLGERLPPEAAVAIVSQAASGLDYAHRKRDEHGRALALVHRDISPHNLFITREGHVRVLDFGIAKSVYQQQRTQSGVLKGKLPYMAPEQARGGDLDGRADQFALGVVLWECLTGKRLFARDDPFQTMNALFELKVDPPSARVAGIHPELDRITLKCLSREPEARFDTCGELAEALRTWLRASIPREETAVVAAVLEHAVPPREDLLFYGFDPSSTAPKVELPVHRPIGDDIDDEETRLRGKEATPSTSGVAPIPQARTKLLASPPERPTGSPKTLTVEPTPGSPSTLTMEPMPRAARRPRAVLGFAVLGALLALAVVVGATVALTAGGADDRAGDSDVGADAPDLDPGGAPTPPVDREARVEIEVRFERVPDDAVIEVNGLALEGRSLRTVASTETRSIRVMRDGHQLWRYDAVFTESTDVVVPELSPALWMEPEPPPTATTTTRRRSMATSTRPTPENDGAMRRLGTGIELDYP